MRRALVPLLGALLVAGCAGGTPSADLFAVERTGRIPGGELRMVVSDGGGVTCNGRPGSRMTDQQLLDARDIARDLETPAKDGLRLRPAGQSILQYRVHTGDGTLSFADDSRGKPAVLDRLAFFVRRLAKERCGLKR
jgi:hypothetical protein